MESACDWSVPTKSKTRSAPLPPVISRTASTEPAPSRTSPAPSSAASARRRASVSIAIVALDPSSRRSWSAMWPTPPTPISDSGRAGNRQVRQPSHGVVRRQPRVGVRRDGRRLDAVRKRDERALRDEHVVGEAAVDGQAGELVVHAVHVVAATTRDAEAAAVGRIHEHGIARATVVTPLPISSTQPAFSWPRTRGSGHSGRLHQAFDRVQVGGADAGATDPDDHVGRVHRLGVTAAR